MSDEDVIKAGASLLLTFTEIRADAQKDES